MIIQINKIFISLLNKKTKSFFSIIIAIVNKKERNSSYETVLKGGGGTCKSHVVNVVKQLLLSLNLQLRQNQIQTYQKWIDHPKLQLQEGYPLLRLSKYLYFQID